MHELGVVLSVVETVEKFARDNNLTRIGTLVLEIGELSSIIPKYVESCYPAAVDGTLLENTELKIEIIPGNGLCRDCGKVFNLKENHLVCPHCGSRRYEMLSGREFMIKEITAY